MCGDPREMLEGALAEMSEPERKLFEDDYQHFASYSQLSFLAQEKMSLNEFWIARTWARWAFWSGGNYRVRREK
jgi:hypothetical protein